MTALLEQLRARKDIELAVVASAGMRDAQFIADGVQYFVIRTPLRRGIWNRLGSYRGQLPLKSQVEKYASIVNEWDPDVVHIHGTEESFGLIKGWGLTSKPVAVSLQGVMTPYASKAYGELLPEQIHGRVRSMCGLGLESFRFWKGMLERSRYEEMIIRSADMVLGRTLFDRAWALAFRPDVRYRHVDELMRPEFSQAEEWKLEDCNRYQVFCTSGNRPLKGLHVLIDAVYHLYKTFPEIKVNIASAGFVPRPEDDYARFILALVQARGLERVVKFLGVLSGNELVKQLNQANCYVTPSFIENSSNALGEAMLIGVPIVATFSGGIPTFIESEQTGLVFPAGDSALLAWQMSRIFQDDRLAYRLGTNARTAAMERHNPARVELQLTSAYQELAGTGTTL